MRDRLAALSRLRLARLSYPDEVFDALVSSHVLEHGADDRRALDELRRVLGPGGWGIVMVPICLAAAAVDEGGADGKETAWSRFGQADHVRRYDRDGFLEPLREAGFVVDEWRPGPFDRLRYGLGRGMVLYLVS